MSLDGGPVIIGIQGPSGVVSFTDTTMARTLNTTFMPSAKYAVQCAYTISIACSLSLSGGQTGSVELRCDSNATPTTLRNRVSNTSSGTLTIGLNLVNTQEVTLTCLVCPGYNVRLVSSGTATISITAQAETTITTS